MPEIDCLPSTSNVKLQSDSISFSEIPGQSRLFIDYQNDPTKLLRYYPSAVASRTELSRGVDEVLRNYSTDRDRLCSALTAQNRRFGASERTFENIELLRQAGTVAVVTGQQAGLLTGPIYTVYKALSAIRMAASLRDQGIAAVPVFWAATEDHDFEEIASAFLLGNDFREIRLALDISEADFGRPVGSLPITNSVGDELDGAISGEFAADVRAQIAELWAPGKSIGGAFASNLQQLFRDFGLTVVDPLDPEIKRLAAPIYSRAVAASNEIVERLLARTAEIEKDGYHAQVLITPDYFPLFYHDDSGVRRSLKRHGEKFHVTGTKTELKIEDLLDLAENAPDRLSPGVMLRPVVQDFLFPTICYFGGGAEIAYFAQNSVVYETLDRPTTTILHRQSYTIVDSRNKRILEKYQLKLTDLFVGLESLLPGIVDRFVNPAAASLFTEVEENIEGELQRLDGELSKFDPTLSANLGMRRRKIAYHIDALRKKFRRAQIERDEIVNRQLRSLFGGLLPGGQLQERRLNAQSFLARYGPAFINLVYESVDLDERGHRVLYLS